MTFHHKMYKALVAVGLTMLALSPAANAILYTFEGVLADNPDVAHQLFLDVSPMDTDQLLFEVINDDSGSSLSSIIAAVYFDDRLALLNDLLDLVEVPGVNFNPDPPGGGNFPEGSNLNPAFITYAFTAKQGAASNGVNPGETLGIVFGLTAGSSYDDVIHALDSGDLRVGYHVIAIAPDGESDSFVNNGRYQVPDGGSTLALLSGAMMVMAVIRRKRS